MGKDGRAATSRATDTTYGDEWSRCAVRLGGRGEYRKGCRTHLLVLLRDTRRPRCAAARPLPVRGAPRRTRRLVMSEREFRGSADVVPVELADIRDAHGILTAPTRSPGGVRRRPALQLEREMKSAYIRSGRAT